MPSTSSLPERSYRVELDGVGPVALRVGEDGTGPPWLLLHGGGGPRTMAILADLLREAGGHVVAPTHPGFAGTARPVGLLRIAQLAALYVGLLDLLDLSDVTVVGSSIGGWVAVEMALLRSPRIGRLVLLDCVGIEVAESPILDFFSVPLDEVARYNYVDPERFRADTDAPATDEEAVTRDNRSMLSLYAGPSLCDPTLATRLAEITLPSLVLWGEGDRIVDVEYGRAFAQAIPSAQFSVVAGAGHLPQVETPTQVLDAVRAFARGAARERDGATDQPGPETEETGRRGVPRSLDRTYGGIFSPFGL